MHKFIELLLLFVGEFGVLVEYCVDSIIYGGAFIKIIFNLVKPKQFIFSIQLNSAGWKVTFRVNGLK